MCLQVLALVFIRKLLDFFFTKRELSWLDDLMPESKKKKEDDKKKKAREKLVKMFLVFFSFFFLFFVVESQSDYDETSPMFWLNWGVCLNYGWADNSWKKSMESVRRMYLKKWETAAISKNEWELNWIASLRAGN